MQGEYAAMILCILSFLVDDLRAKVVKYSSMGMVLLHLHMLCGSELASLNILKIV